jgi:hypothetical protein
LSIVFHGTCCCCCCCCCAASLSFFLPMMPRSHSLSRIASKSKQGSE